MRRASTWLLPGPWLEPGFRKKGHVDFGKNSAVVVKLIDQFNAMLKDVSKRGEDVKGLVLELYRGLGGPKLAASKIEAKAPESDLFNSLRATHNQDLEQLCP